MSAEDEQDETPTTTPPTAETPSTMNEILSTNPPPNPLPDGWIMHKSKSQPGYAYYFNQFTGECQWDVPFVYQLEQGLMETLASLTQQGTVGVESDGQDLTNNNNIEAKENNNNDKVTNNNVDDASNEHRHSKKRSSSHHHEKSHHTTKKSKSTPDKVRVLHILKKHRDSRRPSSWRQAKITISKEKAISELEELITILQDVMNDSNELKATFEELAKEESDCSSAKRGGDLGFFERGKMQPPFEKASFALNVGELSEIVETSSGVHVILRLG